MASNYGHSTEGNMFKIVMRPRGGFLVELPDGTRTKATRYDMMLSFFWQEQEYIAQTAFYGDERIMVVKDCECVLLDESTTEEKRD